MDCWMIFIYIWVNKKSDQLMEGKYLLIINSLLSRGSKKTFDSFFYLSWKD